MARKKINQKAAISRAAVQNAVKTLAANIRFSSVDKPVSSIVVASTLPGEGKTFVAIELARALAAGGNRVLLFECDMRKRSLAAQLGVHGRRGLYSVLSGEVSASEAIMATKTKNLSFLDVEPGIPNPTDIIASRRFRSLLESLCHEYSYVIMDTPPLSIFVDAAMLGAAADATILVVRENYTKREAVLAAYQQLGQADANVVGAVLNGCEDEGAGSGNGNYYDYYANEAARVQASSHHHHGGSSHAHQQAAPQRTQPQPPAQPVQRPQQPAQAQAPAQPQPVNPQPAPRAPEQLKPIPTQSRATVSPESTAQFLARTRYAHHDLEE